MKVKVHIFAEGKHGKIYTVGRQISGQEIFEDSELIKFVQKSVETKYETDAIDLEGKIQLMAERYGVLPKFFREEHSQQRPRLKALPGKIDNHRVRIYGYRKSNELALIGSGAGKPHRQDKWRLDDFPECKKAADFIVAVEKSIKRNIDAKKIVEHIDGYYDMSGNLLREFVIVIPDSFK